MLHHPPRPLTTPLVEGGVAHDATFVHAPIVQAAASPREGGTAMAARDEPTQKSTVGAPPRPPLSQISRPPWRSTEGSGGTMALLLLFNLLFIWAAARSTNRQVPPPSLWIPFFMRQISKEDEKEGTAVGAENKNDVAVDDKRGAQKKDKDVDPPNEIKKQPRDIN